MHTAAIYIYKPLQLSGSKWNSKMRFSISRKKIITVTFWSTRNTHMHTSICLYVYIYICITRWIMKYVEGEWFRIDIHLTISIAAPANAKSKYKGANHTFSRKCKLSHKSHSQRINSLYLAAQWNIWTWVNWIFFAQYHIFSPSLSILNLVHSLTNSLCYTAIH